MSSFTDKMKDVLSSVGSKVQELGDKSVLKIEIRNYESQIAKCKQNIGEIVFKAFSIDKDRNVSAKNQEVAALVSKIENMLQEIETRKLKLADIDVAVEKARQEREQKKAEAAAAAAAAEAEYSDDADLTAADGVSHFPADEASYDGAAKD